MRQASTRLVRERVAEIIKRAETDKQFSERLRADPGAVLEEHGIGAAATVAMLSDVYIDLGGSVMNGCNDGTCFSSGCPDSCFVTVCGTTDCGETYPPGTFGEDVERWVSR